MFVSPPIRPLLPVHPRQRGRRLLPELLRRPLYSRRLRSDGMHIVRFKGKTLLLTVPKQVAILEHRRHEWSAPPDYSYGSTSMVRFSFVCRIISLRYDEPAIRPA